MKSDAISEPSKPPARPRATSFDPAVASAFGSVVRQLRETTGIAQDRFALLAEVDRSYYGKLERGERQPSLALMLRIARALSITASSLVERVESKMALSGPMLRD